MDIRILKRCFEGGIKNYYYYVKKHNIKKHSIFFIIKYYLWLITVILFSPRKSFISRDVIFIYGDLHERIFLSESINKKVYIGLGLKNFHQIINNASVLSIFPIKERLKILVESIKTFRRTDLSLRLLHFWIDFYLIYIFLRYISPDSIKVAGHFDKYTTWLSYIAHYNSINFSITQHGAIEKIYLPSRIYCNNVYVYNEYEKKFIYDYLLLNKDCNFYIKGFKSYLNFTYYQRSDGKYIIGLASQDLYTHKTIELIQRLNLLNINKEIEILVYPHYRENYKAYTKLFRKYGNIKIYPKDRHYNINVLITYFSTIIYDYIHIDKQIKLVCFPPENIEMSFFLHPRVCIINSFEELREIIANDR
jgi:hypothetical protein